MFYYSVKRKIALRLFVGFDWIQLEWQEYCSEYPALCNNLFGNLAQKFRISYCVKNMLNACKNRAGIKKS